MLVLMCHADESRYAIDVAAVLQVLPLVDYRRPADAPAWLAGVFAHRGVATPLVDCTQLLAGHPCPRRWNSRILLVRLAEGGMGMPGPIGLLAERVTIAEIEEPSPGPDAAAVSRLGPILLDGDGMFQLVDLARLLPEEPQERLESLLRNNEA